MSVLDEMTAECGKLLYFDGDIAGVYLVSIEHKDQIFLIPLSRHIVIRIA